MSEQLPSADNWAERETLTNAAREMVGDGYQLGTISVQFSDNDYATGTVWTLATCSECPAELAMRVSHPLHLRLLALDTARYSCAKNGHAQDLQALIEQSAPKEGDPSE